MIARVAALVFHKPAFRTLPTTPALGVALSLAPFDVCNSFETFPGTEQSELGDW